MVFGLLDHRRPTINRKKRDSWIPISHRKNGIVGFGSAKMASSKGSLYFDRPTIVKIESLDSDRPSIVTTGSLGPEIC